MLSIMLQKWKNLMLWLRWLFPLWQLKLMGVIITGAADTSASTAPTTNTWSGKCCYSCYNNNCYNCCRCCCYCNNCCSFYNNSCYTSSCKFVETYIKRERPWFPKGQRQILFLRKKAFFPSLMTLYSSQSALPSLSWLPLLPLRLRRRRKKKL